MKTITLETLHEATAQEVFDRVATHLMKQGRKSLDSRYNCVYKGKDGLKCAAGCLISDYEYKPQFEGKAWGSYDLENLYGITSAHKYLIKRLQKIHDDFNPEDWKEALKNIALREGLNYNCLL